MMLRLRRIVFWMLLLLVAVSGYVMFSCGSEKVTNYRYSIIDGENPGMRAVADVDGDKVNDIFAAVDYESGKAMGLYWYKYPSWKRYVIAEEVNFRADDLTAGDIDNDGDVDLIATVDNNGKVYWYENPLSEKDLKTTQWSPHYIGECKGYVKDITTSDLDSDGELEIVARTKKSILIFKKIKQTFWARRLMDVHGREGMAVADLDKDKDIDIILNGFWLEAPDNIMESEWKEHIIDERWFSQKTKNWQDNSSNIAVSDFNNDGKSDVLICHSEKDDWPIIWYETADPKKGPWTEHNVIHKFNFCETLNAADMNGDGSIDIVAGEMKKSFNSGDLLLFFNNGNGTKWNERTAAKRIGIYNGIVADIGNDGDMDIIGCRDYNKGPIDWWENVSSDSKKWGYISIDRNRPATQMEKMGLVFSDVNNDKFADVIAGSFIYLNPGKKLITPWKKIELPINADVYFSLNIDNDAYCDLIGIFNNNVYWLEALNSKGEKWQPIVLGSVPEGRTQGYITAQIISGKKPELVFTRGKSLYYIEIPDSNPEKGNWNIVQIFSDNEEEGIDAGDIDNDGDIDIAGVSADGHHIIWLENREIKSDRSYSKATNSLLSMISNKKESRKINSWAVHIVGTSSRWSDRIRLKDINNDGRLDIVSTEESREWIINSNIYWFKAPEDPTAAEWERHTVDTLRSVNSLDVSDIDNDGDMDIIAAEHTDQTTEAGASDNLTIVYLNSDNGNIFSPRVVERGGHSSHLGTKLFDLDKDGDLDIVSICWKQYKNIHLWENLSIKK